MAHLKRQESPKKWPIAKKGTTYVVKPGFNSKEGIPILIILRDLLKIAQNRKEVKKAINERNILLNGKEVSNEKNSACLFDILTIVPSKQNYRIELTPNGKFIIKDIKENEAGKKISKVVNKKILKGKKIQLNLSDGKNFLSDLSCKMQDSVLINLTKGEIEKCIPLKENSKTIVIGGKHSGKQGVINKIKQERKMASLIVGNEKLNVLIKQLMAIE